MRRTRQVRTKGEGVHEIQDAPFHPRVPEIDKLAKEKVVIFGVLP
jgi:hypothetical protein